MKPKSKSKNASRLLNIIPKIRLTIWKLALPCGEKLILDKHNIEFYGAISKGDYAAAAPLVRVCKQTHDEVFPLIYSQNTVAVLQPWDPDKTNDLHSIPVPALQHITEVELHLINGLGDMGSSGRMMFKGLPSIKHIRLNIWHSSLWLRAAMELAYPSWRDENVDFQLELFESVHEMHHARQLDTDIINCDLEQARLMANVYDIDIPTTLQAITQSVSVGRGTTYALATFRHDTVDWQFNKDGNKDSKDVKYLVWGPGYQLSNSLRSSAFGGQDEAR